MKKHLIYYLLFVYALVEALTIVYFDGTGDVGDSIAHYLFARYAPYHPVLYFDHWAKPVFVLLASPFAQFGFVGVKVFNALVTWFALLVTYKMAEEMQLKNSLLVVVFMIFSPLFYILTFSGLTEPLFALFTALGIFMCLKQHYLAACIVVSFLPYVRSEGLIIMGVFVLYFMFKQSWKILPWLFFGSIVYGVAGFFVHHDFLWVFTKIPYATMSSVYGSGPLFHFVEQFINVMGVPLYALFWLGFISLAVKMVRKRASAEEGILIWLGFSAFFVAHTLFWYLGIFNSMGLKRVLLGIMPISGIIILQGFNFITEDAFENKTQVKRILAIILIVYSVVFPFTPNPSAIHWDKDMRSTNEHHLAEEVAAFIHKQNNTHYPLLYNHHYLSVTMNVDHFDLSKKINVSTENILHMQSGDFLIWDNRFADSQSGINKQELDKNPTLVNVFTCRGTEYDGEMIYAIYQKR